MDKLPKFSIKETKRETQPSVKVVEVGDAAAAVVVVAVADATNERFDTDTVDFGVEVAVAHFDGFGVDDDAVAAKERSVES